MQNADHEDGLQQSGRGYNRVGGATTEWEGLQQNDTQNRCWLGCVSLNSQTHELMIPHSIECGLVMLSGRIAHAGEERINL